ncbi:hypothetical protein QWA68_004763 [Fusarium oxysporum]|nr:hypothetical protein QWA68_004763 [Fusarium oxysporum]
MRGKLFLLVTDASFPLGYWQKKAHGTRFQKNKKARRLMLSWRWLFNTHPFILQLPSLSVDSKWFLNLTEDLRKVKKGPGAP